MPSTTRVDAELARLRDEWHTKHDEATKIIDNPSATGEQLVRAEKLFNERDQLSAKIDSRINDLDRVDQLRSRMEAGSHLTSQPYNRLPFSATGSDGRQIKSMGHDGAFALSGTEPAGWAQMQYDEKAQAYRMVAEAGPGTFGEQKWALLSSFEYKKDFALYLRKGNRVVDLCHKTLQEGMDDQGGVFTPAELVNRIIGRMPAPTSLRGLVTTLTTGRDVLIMPRKQYSADDKYTTAFRANWTGEIPADGTGAQAAVNTANLLGNIEIPVHTAMLNAPVTKNLIEDSAFPIQAWLESELAQVIDLLYEDMILNGLGVGQPFGMLYKAAAGNPNTSPELPEVILSGSAGAIAYDGLIDIQTALAPQYETPNTRWIMNKKSTYRALNKLKDTQNRPLFTTGYNDSGLVPRRGRVLLGDDVVLSQFMPDVGASNFPIIYGDPKGYYLAQRVGFSIQVLDQTLAKANQIELVGRVRFGGKVAEPFRLKILKSNNS